MDRDRNLLFGVFAVQLKKATSSQIMAAAGAWAADQSKDLPSRLVENQALSAQDCELIQRLVEEAVAVHGGDATATLETFGGDHQVEDTYGGTLAINSDGVPVTVALPNSTPNVASDAVQAVEETPGRYSQLGEHARGGMGKVLLVHDEFLGRDVALKELLPVDTGLPPMQQSPMLQSMSFLSRFLQEARITGQLEHPSIIPVYELGRRKDDTLYYTMKLVRGETLANAIRGCDSLEARLRLLPHFVDLCQAIAYAHSREVIHRDIKPANVMVGEFGETVVLDWGLAKIKDVDDAHAEGLQETLRLMNLGDEAALEKTQYGQLLGTPVYAPPEQLKGQLDQIDERSDVYSLGAVLYQLLTGHPPFSSTSLKDIVRQVLEDQPRPIEHFVPNAPPELITICKHALNKDPDGRYASASALAEDIQRFQSGALVHAHEYRPRDLVRRFVKRNRIAISMGAIAVSLLVVGGIVSWLQLAQERDRALTAQVREMAARDEAEYQAYIAKMQIAYAHFTNGDYRMAVDALQTAPEAFRHWEWERLKAQCEPFESRLEGRGRLLRRADLIYTYSRPSKLRIWNAADKTLLHEIDVSLYVRALDVFDWPLDHTTIKVSSTRDRLGLLTDDSKVILFDLNSSSVVQTIEHDQPINGFTFSPDGQSLFTFDQGRIKETAALDGRIVAQYTAPAGTIFGSPYWPSTRQSPFIKLSEEGQLFIADLENLDDRVPLYDYSEQFSLVRDVYSSDYLILHGQDDSPEFWDVGERARVSVLSGLEGGWTGEWSSDRAYLYAITKSGQLQQWDLQTGLRRRTYTGNPENVSDVRVSPDGRYIFCFNAEDDALLWRVDRAEPICELTGYGGTIHSATFSNDSQIIVTGGEDAGVRLWSVPDGRLLREFKGHTAPVDSLQFTSDGATLVSAAGGGEVISWPFDSSAYVNAETIDAHRIESTSDGQILLASGNANRASVLNAENGHAFVEFMGAAPMANPAAIALCENAGRIAVGLNDIASIIAVWNTREARPTSILEGHQNTIQDLEISADGELILSASSDGTVKIWTDSELLHELEHNAAVTCIDLDSAGDYLVTATETGSVAQWNTTTWEPEWIVPAASSRITRVEFVDLIDAIVVGTDDGSVMALNRNGVTAWELAAHSAAVNDFDISEDKRRLLTASADGSVKNWDLSRLVLVNSLTIPDTDVLLAGLVPEGHRLTVAAQARSLVTANAPVRIPQESSPMMPGANPNAGHGAQWLNDLNVNDGSAIVSFWTRDELERAVSSSSLGLRGGRGFAPARDGLKVQEGPSLMTRIGLRLGDVVTEVDSTPATTQKRIREQLSHFLSADDSSAPLTLTARRNERTVSCTLFLVEPIVREVEAPIPKAVFRQAVPMALNTLEKQFGQGVREQQRAADAIGVPLSSIPGIYVPEQSEAITAYLKFIHVQPGDFILSFAGEPTRSLDEFKRIATSVANSVNEGELIETEMLVARGIYHRLRVKFRLE